MLPRSSSLAHVDLANHKEDAASIPVPLSIQGGSMSSAAPGVMPQIVHPREWAVPAYLSESRHSALFQVGGQPPTSGVSTSSSATPLAQTPGTYLERLQARLDATTSGSNRHNRQRIPLPSKLDPKQCCKRLHIMSDTKVQFLPERDEQGREKLNRHDPDKDAAAVRADQPIPSQAGVYYYEVEVISKGQKGYIGIGFSTRGVDLERLPGWNPESYGYHGDDGKAFACSGTGQAYGPRFSSGDIIGCGIDFIAKKAFFVKNGRWLGYVFDLRSALRDPSAGAADPGAPESSEPLPASLASRRERERERERRARENAGPLRFYPTIGLQTVGENVKMNFGQEPFKFDIESFMKRRRQEVTQEVLQWGIPSTLLGSISVPRALPTPIATSVDPPTGSDSIASSSSPPGTLDPRLSSTLESLVSGYLNHHGYAETSRAFRRQREAERANWADLLVPRAADPDQSVAGTCRVEMDEEVDESQAASGGKAKVRSSGKSSSKRSSKEGKTKSSSSGKSKKDKGDSQAMKTMGSAVRTTLDSGERSDVDLVHSEEAGTAANIADESVVVQDDLMMSDVPPATQSERTLDDLEEAELRDTARRQQICQSILNGKIDAATADLEEYYPSVLHPSNNLGSLSGTMALPASDSSTTSGNTKTANPTQGRKAEEGMDILFRLRCRKFVELVLASAKSGSQDAEMEEDEESDEEDEQVASALIPSRNNSPSRPRNKGKGPAMQVEEAGDEDLAVEDVLTYGARLNALYPRSLSSPETRNYLNTIFSLVAFNDPASQPGEIGQLCRQERRSELADAVNKAILASEGRPGMAKLELVYRQVHATTSILGEIFGEARAALLGNVLA